MLLLELFFEFFKIGLFSVGGGLATLPFLYELANAKDWISVADISNLVAVSESTPGPLGVNMSTYVGFLQSGVLGGIIASLSLVLPSVIIIIIISGFLNKFKESKLVKNIFYGLRAASCALIASAGIGVAKLAFLGSKITDFFWQGALLAVIMYFAIKKLKWHPIAFIAISAAIGIIFKFEL
ncbi:MAG: chromate transporter [Clostridia bacterium]|nr:chromate transporter [Clostridia bacterium]